MMEQQHPLDVHLSTASASTRPTSCLSSVLRFVVVTYLLGMFVLSVEQFLLLPSNLSLVDFWNILFLPLCWLYLIRIHQAVRFPYTFGMWLIWLGSFIGTLFALNPLESILVITKEVYLYVWCVTLSAVFASLEPGLLRRVLLAWTAVAVLHGGFLVAEFVSPDFYSLMISTLGSVGKVYIGRPSGLFENPISAAFFQLMGFVPLLLGGLRRELALLLGMFLLLSILATASLGTLSGLAAASAVAVIALLLVGGNLKFLVWLAAAVAVAAGLFFFTIGLIPDVRARLQHLTTERAEYTTDQRLDLWQGGSEALFSKKSILGVGPNNYRDSFAGKTLHNDFLEFGVERGVVGLLGLLLFGLGAMSSAVKILLNQSKLRDTARPTGVIFIAMLVAALLISNANQIFHFRVLWLGLALQEAILFRMISPSIETVTKPAELQNERPRSREKSSSLTDHNNPSSVEVG
jgi:O-antigen ligase